MQEVLRAAIDKWGEDMQLIVATEELSELIKEICKYERGKGNIEHLGEEVADVEIVLEQLDIIYGTISYPSYEASNFKQIKKEIGSLMEHINLYGKSEKVKFIVFGVKCKLEWLKTAFCLYPSVADWKLKKIERLEKLLY